jgi:exodeoxyribonuclease V alpha subunit
LLDPQKVKAFTAVGCCTIGPPPAALFDRRFQFDQREVAYDFGELDEVALAYAITIHKSQGSEFPVVVTPLATQHYLLLQRNLVYTGITRGKKLVVLIGQRKALAIAVRNNRTENRFSGLLARLLVPG